ncbi:MAG: hypothetical protein ACO3ND_05335 [Opitutales bacterium]
MFTPVSNLRHGRIRSRFLGFLAGLCLFVLLLAALVVWAAGRFSPGLLDSALISRSGSSLSVETNDTNLFVGRIAYGGLRLTSSSRWQEKDLIKARAVKIDFDVASFSGAGPRVIRELVLDVEELVVAGKEDYLTDNSLSDLVRAFSAEDAAGAGPAARAVPYRIDRLSLRVARVRLVAGDGTDRRRVVADRQAGIALEVEGVTGENIDAKVWKPLSARLTSLAAEVGLDTVVDRARERILRAAEDLLKPR